MRVTVAPGAMRITVDAEQGQRLDAALDRLLPDEPHLAYANFRPVARRPGAAQALHRARLREPGNALGAAPGNALGAAPGNALGAAPGEGLGVLVARDADGAPLAALRVDDRPFESDHFGLRMAKIEAPVALADEALREPALAALYRAALERLADGGWQHAAARASTRDPVAAWALQQHGGIHVDTQVSWMASLSGEPVDEPVAPPLRIETLHRDDLARLAPASWKRLAQWGGQAFDRGPLVFDRSLPRDRTFAVYEVWTERVMTGDWADAVLVARDGDEVVAFISMLEMPDVSEAAGEPVCGRGLGATLPEYRGLFTAIQREMIAERPLGAAFMENETQVSTLGSINVYAKLGFRYLRSTATYHFRLGRPSRGDAACG